MEPSAVFSLLNFVSKHCNLMLNFFHYYYYFFFNSKKTLLLTLPGNKVWSLCKTDLQVTFSVAGNRGHSSGKAKCFPSLSPVELTVVFLRARTQLCVSLQGLVPRIVPCYMRRREFPLGCSRRGGSVASGAENALLIKSNCEGSSTRGELKVLYVPCRLAPTH